MARLALNKSQLKKERDKLKLFEKVLPSLELKRMQLTAEWKRMQSQLMHEEAEVARLGDEVAKQLPMLAYRQIGLERLVTVKNMRIDEENIVGVRLPLLGEIDFEVVDYSMLAKPHWVDVYVERMKEMVVKRVTVKVAQERVSRLDLAVRRITQRVNLFEKILIPSANKNIQRIRIFLGDADRSAIVRSKIAKAMHQKQRKQMVTESEMQ